MHIHLFRTMYKQSLQRPCIFHKEIAEQRNLQIFQLKSQLAVTALNKMLFSLFLIVYVWSSGRKVTEIALTYQVTLM